MRNYRPCTIMCKLINPESRPTSKLLFKNKNFMVFVSTVIVYIH